MWRGQLIGEVDQAEPSRLHDGRRRVARPELGDDRGERLFDERIRQAECCGDGRAGEPARDTVERRDFDSRQPGDMGGGEIPGSSWM